MTSSALLHPSATFDHASCTGSGSPSSTSRSLAIRMFYLASRLSSTDSPLVRFAQRSPRILIRVDDLPTYGGVLA